MKRRLRLVVGVMVSVVFLYLAMRKIEWDQLWSLFVGANYLYLVPALLLLILINWVRAYRWRLLMTVRDRLPLTRVFWMVNIGYLFNNILPAKAGELVRAYMVGRLIPGGIGQALSTLLIERLLDVLTLVVLLAVLIPFVALPLWATKAGLVFGGVAMGGTIVLVVLSRFGDRGVDWIWRLVGRLPLVRNPKVKEALGNLLDGFGVLTVGKLLPGIVLGSAAVWLGYALFNYTIMAAFRMTSLPFVAASLVLCATGFSMILPSSPGAYGVFEWAAIQALAVYSVKESPAFGYAFGLHTFTILASNVLGLLGLFYEGVSYTSIRRRVLAGAGSSANVAAPPDSAALVDEAES